MLKLPTPTCEQHWKTWYVAFSGGLDSTVLLHMLWQQKLPVHAIHVNHQLQTQANLWEEHCADICKQWDIPFIAKKVVIDKKVNQSLEAVARTARYDVFKEFIIKDTVICTAHHQDDQAETVLLQLLRGAGVAGLAAMPTLREFAQGFIFRPLLNFTRNEIYHYAKQHHLKWIEDPSNVNIHFDRNYLRQEIFPRLKKRWPSASRTIARSAAHCAEAADLIREMNFNASFPRMRESIRKEPRMESCFHKNHEKEKFPCLSISKLQKLSSMRQKNIIRYWLEQNGFSLPSTAQMEQIQSQLLNSREDANPLVHFTGTNIRRYRDFLYVKNPSKQLNFKKIIIPWNDLTQPLILPHNLGTLKADKTKGQGLNANKIHLAPLTVRFRQGGERCQPEGRAHSQTLKKLFQEYGVPTWKRDQIPLLFCGDQLAAVIGYWYCVPFVALHDENYIFSRLEDGSLETP